MLEDFRLKVFESVARLGSFTAAAKELGVSQPAVSQNISELEKAVGEPLFVRTRADISLTDTGAEFLRYASRILFLYDRAESIFVKKTEAPEHPTLLNIDSDRCAEISVEDGEIRIKVL